MELLKKSLNEYLHDLKTLSIKTVTVVAFQVLERLQAMHEKGYIHRDIKPANIMLDKDQFTVYLIDFGLSKLYKDVNS